MAAAILTLFGIAAAGGASSAVSGSSPPPPAAGVTSAGDPSAGRALYLASCAACHGVEARGTTEAPPLSHAGTALIDFMLRTGRMPLSELGQPIRRGAPVMGEQQIADVVAYLQPLTDGPAIPEIVVSSGDLALGRGLFTANCAACHGAAGAGDAIGGAIVAPDLRSSGERDVAEAIVGGPPPMPRFSFTPDELAAVNAYVQYLRGEPSPGGSSITAIGPVAEGFIAGFVGLVALLVIVRWVGRSSRLAQQRPVPTAEQPYSGEPLDSGGRPQ